MGDQQGSGGKDRRRPVILLVLFVLVVLVILLSLWRCTPGWRGVAPGGSAGTTNQGGQGAGLGGVEAERAEVLTPATLTMAERIEAGAPLSVYWIGPANPGDFLTIVPAGAAEDVTGDYRTTDRGTRLELTAPIEPGEYEVRYVAGRSRTVLGRAGVRVESAGATLEAPGQVVAGSVFSVSWRGPGNAGDFVTVVAKGAADDAYASYADATGESPVELTAPMEAGEAEVRYVTGQGRRVLARRAVVVVSAQAGLTAPEEAIAGATIEVGWTGPNNAGDYVTVVEAGTPDGRYANYTNTASGNPLRLLLPIMEGEAEIRYMSGQGHRVLGRRGIRVVAASVTLRGPERCEPGAMVSVSWSGPDHAGDYITIVARGTPDGQHAAYTNTSAGSPLRVRAPSEAGEAEIRYMTGQGNKVLARVPILIAP